jgi:MFS family permease
VGQFFGGFACSHIADRYGRKITLLIGLLLATGGIFGEVFSNAKVAFLISKLILGVGLGFYLTVGPLYCSEVSPVVLRGITTAGINLAICIGQLLSNAAIKGFGGRSDSWAYRGPFMIQLLFVGKDHSSLAPCSFLTPSCSTSCGWITLCPRITLVLCAQKPT